MEVPSSLPLPSMDKVPVPRLMGNNKGLVLAFMEQAANSTSMGSPRELLTIVFWLEVWGQPMAPRFSIMPPPHRDIQEGPQEESMEGPVCPTPLVLLGMCLTTWWGLILLPTQRVKCGE
jgi:hypothetical protein